MVTKRGVRPEKRQLHDGSRQSDGDRRAERKRENDNVLLLERFYTPQEGSVTLGADPIDQFSLISWRSQIGYVSQESPLIAGTIRDNICYGLQREVTLEELKRASQMAYADTFIEELPQSMRRKSANAASSCLADSGSGLRLRELCCAIRRS